MKLLKALIVEDSEDDALMLLRYLKKSGFQLEYKRVESADEMQKALFLDRWEIVLSDFSMPQFTGLHALDLVKKSGLDIPFIMISGTIGEEIAVQAMLAGVNDYFVKGNLGRLGPAIDRELHEAVNRHSRRQIEKDLIENKKRLQLALSAAAMGVWEWNITNNEIYASPECYDIIQIEEGKKLYPFGQHIYNEDRENFVQAIHQAVETQSHYFCEFRILNSKNDLLWYQHNGITEYDEDMNALRMIGTIQNITERKISEENLRLSEENYRALVQATTQFVWTAREDGKSDEILEWFAEYGEICDVETDDWINFLHCDDRQLISESWQKATKNKQPFDINCRFSNKKKQICHLAIRSIPVFNSDGSFRQWIGTFEDITNQVRAEEALQKSEEQLRQSQKLESVGRLAGGIAHDFNNMLTAINGYSDLSLRNLGNETSLKHYIEEIKKAGERSASLTQQLLAFSRQQILQVKTIDLNQTIIDSVVMLQRLVGEDVQIVHELDQSIDFIEGDNGQISQMIMNLIVNARDAMPQGGTIKIKTKNFYLDKKFTEQFLGSKIGNYVKLSVSDEGCGIDDEIKDLIFEPFFTTKGIGKGTGLGLATVYGIINQSGGYIRLESEIEKGTTFFIYLPSAAKSEPSVEKIVSSNNFKVGNETILLVEDEELVRNLSKQVLEECGYKVIEAQNGIEALSINDSTVGKISLLLTDVVMPQMSGNELADKLLKSRPDLKVLFTSGYTNDSIVHHGVSEEEMNFIQKPFSFEELADKVRKVLDEP